MFNEEALQASDEIILCESLIDALTFWVAGYRNVTASYRTSGFTDDHLAAFMRHGIQRVLIAYDRDEAGNNAAEALAEKLTAEGIDCFRVQFPKGMGANEYAQQVQPAAKSLGMALRSAQWMGQGQAPEIGTGTAADEVIDTETGEILATPESPEEPEPSPSLVADPAPITEPTTASPQPKLADEIQADISEHEINMAFGDRYYRIRGLQKNMSFEVLKVNVLVRRGDAFHVDSLELYNAKQRVAYIKAAGIELGLKEAVIKTDLGKVLLKCEALQEAQIKQTLEPEKQEQPLTESEQSAALKVLQSSDLMNRIAADFEHCGVVGEATNTLVNYLSCVSHKLDKPLAVMIQSTSAAGKSTLMDAVLALMPEEERVQYSAMTSQSLFYMGETNLKNKTRITPSPFMRAFAQPLTPTPCAGLSPREKGRAGTGLIRLRAVRVIPAILEARKEVLKHGVADRFPAGIGFQVSFSHVGGLRGAVDQDMVPGPVLRWARPGHCFVPFLSGLEIRVHVDDDAAIIEQPVVHQFAHGKLRLGDLGYASHTG